MHDTFGDVLARLNDKAVEGVFKEWLIEMIELIEMKGAATPKSIAIDGKTVRHSGNETA